MISAFVLGVHLFGQAYTGLQFDYLGICHVYESLREYDKYLKFANIMDHWNMLRNHHATTNVCTFYKIIICLGFFKY